MLNINEIFLTIRSSNIIFLLVVVILSGCSGNPKTVDWEEKITAMEGRPLADASARLWNKEAILWLVYAPGQGSYLFKSSSGVYTEVVTSWMYYYKHDKQLLQIIVNENKEVKNQESIDENLPKLKHKAIGEIQIDSQDAILIAMSKGGVPHYPPNMILHRVAKLKGTSEIIPVWITPCKDAIGKLIVRADNGHVLRLDDLEFQ